MLRAVLCVGLLLGGAITTVACTAILGIDKDYVEDPADAGDDAADAAAEDAPQDAWAELDKACDGPSITASCRLILAPCCKELGFSFDKDKCEARAKKNCADDVAEVKAGRMTFHPDNADACEKAIEGLPKACTANVVDAEKNVLAEVPCAHVFEGQVPQTKGCERSEQCAPLPQPDVLAVCGGVPPTCLQLGFLGGGNACVPGAQLVVCGPGLYCAPDGSQMVCLPVVALHGECDPGSAVCGIGAYCDDATSRCLPGQDPGASCANGEECASGSCDQDAGTCTDFAGVVSKTQCAG